MIWVGSKVEEVCRINCGCVTVSSTEYGYKMRFFNTEGAIKPEIHYYLKHRLDVPSIKQLIEQQKYWLLHAPRQTGKTTTIQELAAILNEEGFYKALYINAEPVQAARNDIEKGMLTLLHIFYSELRYLHASEDQATLEYLEKQLQQPAHLMSLYDFLQYWTIHSAKPLVLFIDEVDALVGDTLISLLRQIRSGYVHRPQGFPQSICLIGVRDLRDYRIWSEEHQAPVLGGSAFNIKSESFRLSDFSLEDIRALYLQHTQETGQVFTEGAIQYSFDQSQGQPWLVNALVYQACSRLVLDRSQPITQEVLEQARDGLILRRDTHLDVLIDRLNEPRVRHIIDAIINGQSKVEAFVQDDVQYVYDLGLIAPNGYEIANPIYREILPRALSTTTETQINKESFFYKNADGSLNTNALLENFTQFYRENSSHWLADCAYQESGPHLLLMAFLQRLINGGGRISREYALHRKRVDLLIQWPAHLPSQRIVIELKILQNLHSLTEGLRQTAEYMDLSNATEGHLVLFNRDQRKTWAEKIYQRQEIYDAKKITLWGL